jgi:enoyl-CoA hydratase/carnithine racemase
VSSSARAFVCLSLLATPVAANAAPLSTMEELGKAFDLLEVDDARVRLLMAQQ